MASIQQTPQGPVLVLKESALQQKGKDAQKNNITAAKLVAELVKTCLLYTSPSPRDRSVSRMPSSA